MDVGVEDVARFRAIAAEGRLRAADARRRAAESRRGAEATGDPWVEVELRTQAAALSLSAANEELHATLGAPA